MYRQIFGKIVIHLWLNCQEYFIYMYGKRSGPLSIKYLIHVCPYIKCNVAATVFICIGCANTIFVNSILVFIIVNELSVSSSLY